MRYNYFFWLCSCLMVWSTAVLGQVPCGTQLSVMSENADGDSTTVICNGRPLTLYASITPSDCSSCSYAWSNGSNNIFEFAFVPGTYSVTVTENIPGGCTWVSAPITITSTTLAAPVLSQDSINICEGQRNLIPFTKPAWMEALNICTQCRYDLFQNVVPLGPAISTTTGNPRFGPITMPGEYFIRVTAPNSPACQEDSRLANIGIRTVSVPPILTTTSILCDTNTATLSTINCNNCSYQWQFYDYEPEGKLVITGVFEATRLGLKPTGVELYAIGQIPDLSQYTIRRTVDGASAALTDEFTFPSVSLPAGSFIYVTDESDLFATFFGTAPNYTFANIAIDGNDGIELVYGGHVVDVFGNVPVATSAADFPAAWEYRQGWNYRDDNSNPNVTFTPTDWTPSPQSFRIDTRNNAFWGANAFPTGTYTTTAIPETELGISSVFADSVGLGVRGIEFMVFSKVFDLSQYTIGVHDASGIVTYASLGTGTRERSSYCYLTDDATAFTNFFSISTNVQANPLLASMDGLDAIVLYKNGVVVDVYGDTTFATPISWDYSVGWSRSSSGRVPGSAFNVTEWTVNTLAFNNCTGATSSTCTPSLSIGTTAFTEYPSKLVVSGVFDNNRGLATESRGIELYAIADIPDVSVYNIEILEAGNNPPNSTIINLPSTISLNRGDYLYVVNSQSDFLSVYGAQANIWENTGVNVLDGNDAVLVQTAGSVTVDAMGPPNLVGFTTATDFTDNWVFQDGWIYRLNNTNANAGGYSASSWLPGVHYYRPQNTNFGINAMPVTTYSNNNFGTVANDIAGANTPTYTTPQVGSYLVEVTFENGCLIESDLLKVDTSIFRPRIADTLGSEDVAYLCSGGVVELSIQQPYLVPPNWSYQWSRNGIDLPGETGYRHTATMPGRYRVHVLNSDGCAAYSNSIEVINSTNGANPGIAASSSFLCPSNVTSSSRLVTATCTGCSYTWFNSSDLVVSSVDANEYVLYNGDAGGYYVQVTDQASGCKYQSPIVVVSDTVYPSPLLTTSGNTVCSATPINISTTPCAGCTYNWEIDVDTNGGFAVLGSTRQAIERVNTSGKYRLAITYTNGCRTNYSNTLQVTFKTVNANLLNPPVTSICNGDPVILQAIPDSASAPALDSFEYIFLRDGVPMQKTLPPDEQSISSAGNYQVVVTNIHNCSDTSSSIAFQEVNISTRIRPSANKICSSTHSVIMEIDSCVGCSYQWYLGATSIITQRDTFYEARGYAAADNEYFVEVSKGGCTVRDSFYLDSVPERLITIELDSTVSTSPTMCDGTTVQLTDTCLACIQANYYQYQWYLNNSIVPGASFESHLVDTPGFYYVYTIDTNGCVALSNTIQVQEFVPDPNLALDFSALGSAVPVTYGKFDLNDHLQPTRLRYQGRYSSLTAQAAIDANTDTINVGVAGSGYHFIYFSYLDSNALGSCTFSTYDTLYVLGSVAMDIANSNPNVPATEACIGDVLDITLTNFTFVPNEVLFVTSGGGYIPVSVNPVLTVFAGVFSGTFQVTVPPGARTGKITVTDGNDRFESPNFYVINNPSVAIGLTSTSQPICSTLDSAQFLGVPLGGNYHGYIAGNYMDTIMSNSLLWLDSVSGYTNGVQYVMVYYDYTPLYTGIPASTASCPVVTDSILVEVRDASLDSVVYTPVSVTQTSESLYNLTKVVYPVTFNTYASSYTGTYVLANNLLPSTVPLVNNDITSEAITYQVNNGGCINTSVDSIDLWPAPSLLDSIPRYLCSQDDTVFIQRNTDSLFVTYRNNIIYSSPLYRYQQNNNVRIGTAPDIIYNEYINSMTIRSTNGGVDSINFLPPFEQYYFVPANVTGNSTLLSLDFSYRRVANYFSGGTLVSTDTTEYVIAAVQKNFIIEDPSVVAINPAILADTIFCPVNTNSQLLGIPAGGRYYISGGNLGYQRVPNDIFNPFGNFNGVSPNLNTSYQLTYVYEGRACVDSAATGIFLPDTFSISVLPSNGTGLYCETSPNDLILFGLPYSTLTSIDTASAQFFVRGIQSGTIFSPSQVGPPGDYRVRYVVSDIYGCTEQASDTFTIFPIPNLSMTTLAPRYCYNHDTISIRLFTTDTATAITSEITAWGGGSIPSTDTAWFTGPGVLNGGQYTTTNAPHYPIFYAQAAGVGTHGLSYVYKDFNNCMDSINLVVEILPLPQVYMTTSNGLALDSAYCENDSIPLFGFPRGTSLTSGYGADTTGYNGVPTSLDSFDTAFEPFILGTQPGVLDEVIYYYYEDNNGCRDTARYNIRVRNFTTDPTIAGLQDTTAIGARCADDLTIPVWANLNGGFDLDSLGWFTSRYNLAFSQLTDTLNTDSITFNPRLTYIEFADRNVVLNFHYTDTSRSCFNQVSDTVLIWALPHLTLSEQFANNLNAMDYLGSKLNVPPTDTLHHICETAPEIPVYAYNTTGIYNPFNGRVTLATPTYITPDTGTYIMAGGLSQGIRSNGGTTNIAYGYYPLQAGPGVDTVRYTYTDTRGCTDTIDHIMFVDSLPVLSFAGLTNFDTTINRYVYCQNDPIVSVLPAPIGVRWNLTFDNQNIAAVPFDLWPDTLAVPGVYMDYVLRYNYIGQVYRDGGVCQDSLIDTIQIRPAPQLAWVTVPSSICMSDSSERYPLSATPYGGVFVDATNNFQVTAGIVGDSLFNPAAQAGRRDIFYYYLDTVSGCDDTIQHTIYVYNRPRVNFDITNGCSGRTISFTPRTSPYGMLYNSVAIDSITQVIWNFGDGVVDTFSYLPDTLVIPVDTHTYYTGGLFYPSLTVSNQGTCDTTFVRRIVVSPTVHPYDTLPYEEYFDNANNGWFQAPADTLSANGVVTDSLWQWGVARGNNINTVGNANKVWGTRLVHAPTTYRQGEHGWVYSPCFDLSDLDRPMIQLSLWKHTKAIVDGAILQYYDDSTNNWVELGQHNKGINWYDSSFVVSSPGNQTNVPIGWSGISGTWQNARYRLDNVGQDLRGRSNVRFRLAFASDPGTQLGLYDGIAFDSVKVGNRRRNVLVEHFSAVGYPGMGGIEQQLYNSIFNNLYGRDVNLIQYHIGDRYATDNLYALNQVDNRQRSLFYGIQEADLCRIDGALSGNRSQTSELLNYPILETLDIQMLKDPEFELEVIGFPTMQFGSTGLTATIRVTALKDMPSDNYVLYAVVTKDSMETNAGDTTMAVMIDMFPTNQGTYLPTTWVTGDFIDITITVPGITPSAHNINLINLVAFVQNPTDSLLPIYQSLCTRNLNAFLGSVDSLDISVDNIEDHPGYEATQLSLYPNPTTQGFNVSFDHPLKEDYEWSLVSISGQLLQQGQVMEGDNHLYVSTDNLPSGVYVFVFRNEHVYTQRRVVVKRP